MKKQTLQKVNIDEAVFGSGYDSSLDLQKALVSID